MGTLTRTSSSLVRTLSSLPALKSPMTLCAHAGSTSMQFATSRHPPTSPMCAPGLDSSIRCHTPLLPMSTFCHFANYWNLAHPLSGIMTWTTCLKNLNQWSLMRLKRASAYLTNPNWPAWPQIGPRLASDTGSFKNTADAPQTRLSADVQAGKRWSEVTSPMQLNPATTQLRGRPLPSPMPLIKPDSLSLAAVTGLLLWITSPCSRCSLIDPSRTLQTLDSVTSRRRPCVIDSEWYTSLAFGTKQLMPYPATPLARKPQKCWSYQITVTPVIHLPHPHLIHTSVHSWITLLTPPQSYPQPSVYSADQSGTSIPSCQVNTSLIPHGVTPSPQERKHYRTGTWKQLSGGQNTLSDSHSWGSAIMYVFRTRQVRIPPNGTRKTLLLKSDSLISTMCE